MQKTESNNTDLLIISTSLIGYIFAFNFYINAVLTSSSSLNDKINDILASSNIDISSLNIFIIIIASIVALLTSFIYFLINKLILDFLHVKPGSSKLFIATLISSIPAPLIGSVLSSINIDPTNTFITFILALVQPTLMSFLLKGDFKKQKHYLIYISILLVFSFMNITIKFFSDL